MKDWKIRQQAFHRLNHTPTDLHPVVYCPNWLADQSTADIVASYFVQDWTELLQPHKAFAVAIIYATLMERHGIETYAAALADPHLLLNDAYFHPRSPSTESIYVAVEDILTTIDGWDFEKSRVSQVSSTVDYFVQEFID